MNDKREIIMKIVGFLLLIAAIVAVIVYRARNRKLINVVLVSIDTLRLDHLGCYGYAHDTSPTILELAGLPQSPETLGTSLVPLFDKGTSEKEDVDRPALIELYGFAYDLEGLRSADSKVVLDYKSKTLEYYNLESDSAEKNPLTDPENPFVQKAVRAFKSFKSAMHAARQAIPWGNNKAPEMDKVTKDRLKSLGYAQ